jgi:enoyl-CoA hydratase/carnithine racemase
VQAERFALLLAETYRRLLLLPIPLICGVDGPVMGGGVGLAMAADVVWAGPEARFTFPETRIGLVPALVSVVARRRLRPATLQGMTLSATEVDPSDALRLGLVDRLSAASAAEDAEREARRILRENSPSAMRETKAFLQTQFGETLEWELEAAVAEFRRAAGTEACRRGLQAFREKRALTWRD